MNIDKIKYLLFTIKFVIFFMFTPSPLEILVYYIYNFIKKAVQNYLLCQNFDNIQFFVDIY